MKRKRKLKPSSEVLKVLNVMQDDANTSVKELVDKTGLSKQKVYSARHYLKKYGLAKQANKPSAPKPSTVQKVETPKVVIKAVTSLRRELITSKEQIAGLQSELNRVRHLYMDQLAVVRYLEVKLMQFVEANSQGKRL